MNQPIQEALESSFSELLALLPTLSQEQLNAVPFAGSWTAGQVGEHLVKSFGLLQVAKGHTVASQRPADEKVVQIKSVFLNFEVKLQTGDFIRPGQGPFDKGQLLQQLQESTQAIIHFAGTNDLSLTCTDFELPGSGSFTRLEWLYLILYHCQRHIYQLKKIIGIVHPTA